MKRTEQRERTRSALLIAAAEEFESRGYAATSLSHVAEKLGLVRGTVHFHFATKQALAAAIIDHATTRWASLQAESRERAGGVLRSLIWLSHEVADAYATDPRDRAAIRIVREDGTLGVTASELVAQWTAFLTERLADSQQAGEAKSDIRLDVDAPVLLAAFTGIVTSASPASRKTLRQRVDRFWDYALTLIAS
ncbi:MAG: TetR/AcrR family transcriptional regulator [Microbacterium sp.]